MGGYNSRITVIAGPHGSGKTSLAECLNRRRLIVGSWINADEIAQKKYSGWNNPDSTLRAAQEADTLQEGALLKGDDFTFETVLSTDSELTFLNDARKRGAFVKGYFVATEDPSINGKRIAARYMKGGHAVPIDEIVHRYFKSIDNLPLLIGICHRVKVIDNTAEREDPVHICTFKDGILYKLRSVNPPKWVGKALGPTWPELRPKAI